MLDEDEFAKTLIPELFKHNNYASFVRQLNMYGFHKKVGLSDNSMKASERKNKSPSEYYNPYFRRGHPNLLWLINKPKSGASKKKGKRMDDGDGESDEDSFAANTTEDGAGLNDFLGQNVSANRALPAPEPSVLSKKELTVVRDQMATLQDGQRTISEAIARLSREHVQLVNQARQFQEMHHRHENSINAILSFLANVFRKPFEENGGQVRDINELFSGILAGAMPAAQPQQGGSVVDLGDWDQQTPAMATPMGSPPKRHQRLLLPIPPEAKGIKRSASASGTPTPYTHPHQPQTGTVTELFDSPAESASTPSHGVQDFDGTPQEEMMRIMQDVNSNASKSNNGSAAFPDVSANAPAITNDQRNRMLSFMSGGHNGGSPNAATPNYSAPPAPSVSPAPIPASAHPSLSPIMGSSILPPNLHQISQTQHELERLQKLQHDQSEKLGELSSLLGPMSPSGQIPGLADGSSQYFDDNIDFGQYLDSNAYHGDGSGLNPEFDFSTPHFDPTSLEALNTDNLFPIPSHLNGGSRIVETDTPSHNSSSPGGTEEIPRDDLYDSPGRAAKRQRQG